MSYSVMSGAGETAYFFFVVVVIVFHDDNEFIATDPIDGGMEEYMTKGVAHLPDGVVAFWVAEVIIDVFKVVHIGHYDCELRIFAIMDIRIDLRHFLLSGVIVFDAG